MRLGFLVLMVFLASGCSRESAKLEVPKVASYQEAVKVLKSHFEGTWRVRGVMSAAGMTGISLEPGFFVTMQDALPKAKPRQGLFSIILTFSEPASPEAIERKLRHFKEVVQPQFDEVSHRIQSEDFPLLWESYERCSGRMREYDHPAYRTPKGTVTIRVRYLPTDRFAPEIVEEIKRLKSVVESMLEREPNYDWEWSIPAVVSGISSVAP